VLALVFLGLNLLLLLHHGLWTSLCGLIEILCGQGPQSIGHTWSGRVLALAGLNLLKQCGEMFRDWPLDGTVFRPEQLSDGR
jgi:hypothetical protein